MVANTKSQNDKIRIIHVATTKSSIAQKKNQLSEYRVSNISPMGLAIKNIVKKEPSKTPFNFCHLIIIITYII